MSTHRFVSDEPALSHLRGERVELLWPYLPGVYDVGYWRGFWCRFVDLPEQRDMFIMWGELSRCP